MFDQSKEIMTSEIYGVFFETGLPKEFHVIGLNCEVPPTNGIRLTHEQWQDLTHNAGLRKWNGTKVVDA